MIDKLLENNTDLHVRIIVTASANESDSGTLPVKHFVTIYDKGDMHLTKEALDYWNLSLTKDYDFLPGNIHI